MFVAYSDNVVRVGPVGAAQAAKLVNNALMTAITGLVFDAFALGEAFSIDEAGLGRVLAGGSAANPSVGHYLALGGAETFSIRAWPTLHKDIALAAGATEGVVGSSGLLLETAVATYRGDGAAASALRTGPSGRRRPRLNPATLGSAPRGRRSQMSDRVQQLVAELELDEKAALLAGADLWSTVAVERLGIPAVGLTDGPNGARGRTCPLRSRPVPSSRRSACRADRRWGRAGTSTWWSGWDRCSGPRRALKACRVLLAPTVNLHRSPLGGRNFESYSEDPLLAGRIGAAFVRGAQAHGVACTVKHFAGNESELDRMVADTIVDQRTLSELYLVPFELAVREGGVLGMMTSYNRLNGEYCADSSTLLTDDPPGRVGVRGLRRDRLVCVGPDRRSPSPPGSTSRCPARDAPYGPALADAVRDGRVEEADGGSRRRAPARRARPARRPRAPPEPEPVSSPERPGGRRTWHGRPPRPGTCC